jgi:hypothetical protein
MKKTDWTAPLATFIGLIAMVAFIKWPPDKSGDWAGWAQAIGSIVAIFGAFQISERQTRNAFASVANAQALADEKKRKSILAIAEAANDRANSIDRIFSSEGIRVNLSTAFHQSIIDSIIGALSAVPIHEIGSRDGVLALLDIRDQFVFLGKSIEIFLDGPDKHPDFQNNIKDYGEDRVVIRQARESFSGVLAGNVTVHLRAINDSFKILEKSIIGAT